MMTLIHISSLQAWFIFGLVSMGAFIASKLGHSTKKQRTHRRYKKEAKQVMEKLRLATSEKSAFFILRYRCSAYAFEELTALAFKNRGYQSQTTDYSRDGGIDGYVWINGVKHAVQCKKYRQHINAADVIRFQDVCHRKKLPGLFIHCGRTGKKSWQVQAGSNVQIISGNRLLRLLVNEING